VLEDREGERTKPPIIQEEAVNNLLCHCPAGQLQVYGARWDPSKSAEGTDGEAGKATLHHLSAVLANRGSPDDWRIASVTPIYKKGRKKDPGNYRPVSLISVPRNITERFILSTRTGHVKDNQGIRPSQHGFMKAGPA